MRPSTVIYFWHLICSHILYFCTKCTKNESLVHVQACLAIKQTEFRGAPQHTDLLACMLAYSLYDIILDTFYFAYLVGSVLLVDVQDVDAQAVPLLEGACAEGAGELAVPTVHAAGVLQVLVPVVLVGEHLPTAVAPEALPGVCCE